MKFKDLKKSVEDLLGTTAYDQYGRCWRFLQGEDLKYDFYRFRQDDRGRPKK